MPELEQLQEHPAWPVPPPGRLPVQGGIVSSKHPAAQFEHFGHDGLGIIAGNLDFNRHAIQPPLRIQMRTGETLPAGSSNQ